ncbi:MAG: hypothetical protein HN337_02175 [Deltaproteobacteria bacterium]|jgi:two-component system, NtrC family, nitrogen regulation response regulator GlnG|nr:hypothetical protein [Deltaproteobacteria bacterium]
MLPWGKRAENVKRAEELLVECCQQLDIPDKRLGKSGKSWIARRNWDDEASEMRRLIYYAALCSPDDKIEDVHFPPKGVRDHEAFVHSSFESLALGEIVDRKVGHFFERLGNVEVRDVFKTVIDQVERSLIVQCLKWADGNQVKAARVLGINRSTLRKKIEELGIK